MRFGAYILLLLALSVIFYYMGYTSIVNEVTAKGSSNLDIGCPTGTPFCTDQNVVIGAIFLLVLSAGALVALTTGFSAIYIVPILILVAVLYYFVFPLSFIFATTIPDIIRYPLVLIFNTLTVLAVISFIRGGV